MFHMRCRSRLQVVQGSQNQCGQKRNWEANRRSCVFVFAWGCYVAAKRDNLRQPHLHLCYVLANEILLKAFSKVFVTPRWAVVADLWVDSKISIRNIVRMTCFKWLWPEFEPSKLRHRVSITILTESKSVQRTQVFPDWFCRTSHCGRFPFSTKERTVQRLWSSSCGCWISVSLPLFESH